MSHSATREIQAVLRDALRDKYAVERELGRGGASLVFLAHDRKHDRRVALKVLRPELSAAMGTQRFVREVSIAARLQNPHILPLYDSGEAAGLLYYVMPFVEGESLRMRMARGSMSVGEAMRTLKDVLEALVYAHGYGVVHRDVKPDNILLAGRNAMVMDFGVAKALTDAAQAGEITTAGMAVGTPAYMAPEQAAADPGIDHRADIYSFGVLAYELFAGRTPHTGTGPLAVLSAQIHETPVRLDTIRPDLPDGLVELIMRCLAKIPTERWESTESLLAELEAVERQTTIGEISAVSPPRLRRRWLALGAVVVLAGAAMLMPLGDTATITHDPNLLVVAPFDVLYPGHAVWREGIVDVLSAGLDGAGSIRTVPPSLAVRTWSGRADIPSVERLADALSAGLAVFGRVLSSGPDSLRVSASLYDAIDRRLLGQVDVEGPTTRASALGDSLAIRLLRELGRTRPVGAVRRAALGSASLPALRAYLRGEQAFRRAAWDSAIVFYEEAIVRDSSFALAMSRLSRALAWQPETRLDPRVGQYALAAGALNHGLAPRESLLLTADSLRAAMTTVPDSSYWETYRREFATLREGLTRYRNDPEIWHRYGDALFHDGVVSGVAWGEVLQAFDRAIELDSSYTPAYEHAIQVSLWQHGPEHWQPYATGYLALSPTGPEADAIRLVQTLLGASRSGASAQLAGADLDDIGAAFQMVSRWPDASESAVRAARVGTERVTEDDPDYDLWWWRLTGALAYRGHLRASFEESVFTVPELVAELALLGVLSPDTVIALLGPAIDRGGRADLVAPWLAARGDTAGLTRLQRKTAQRARTSIGTLERPFVAYERAVASAFGTLARGDSVQALSEFLALADSSCWYCYLPKLTRVQLLVAAGRYDDARDYLRHELPTPPALGRPADVLWELQRGRVAEQLGRTDEALRSYAFVVNAWADADPELNDFVVEARAALERLRAAAR